MFVALNLPPEERERIYRAVAPLRRAELPVRWIPAEALHLTLKFLGEVAPEAAGDVERVIAAAAARVASFTLRLAGFGAFPTLRRPRVIWMGVAAAPELTSLREELESELAALGFARDTQPFRPHLTLGRARADARARDFRRLEELVAGIRFESRVQASAVELVRSHLTPGGSRYERFAALPLG